MKRVPVIIIGAGKVGRALVRQLLKAASVHEERDGLRLAVVAWCDSNGAVVDPDGLGLETLRAAETAKARGIPLAETPAGYRQGDLAAIVDIAGAEGCIVADLTAGAETIPALELALRRGYGVVTANKVPLTQSQEIFDRLAQSGRCRYESTVGSAVPVIEALNGLLRANDHVERIQGALSGTLGFLCTGLEHSSRAGQPFSTLVAEAMARGYTEPDPRIDLGGMDVARKALILARTMGWRLELSDVTVTSLVPSELAGLPLDQFMQALPALDAEFAARVAEAAGQGRTLRYLAELAGGQVAVSMQPVPQDTALGRLRGTDNLVAFHTHFYPDEPLVLQGRGAGVDVAAAGVHADIVALCRNIWYH